MPSGMMAASATMTEQDSQLELGEGLSEQNADIWSQFDRTIQTVNEKSLAV